MTRLPTASFLLAVGAFVVLLVVPLYASVSTTFASEGGGQLRRDSLTLLEVEGPRVVPLLAVPVLVASVPVLVRGRANRAARVLSAVVLLFLTVLAAASVGIFFLPSAAVMVAAAARSSSAA
jgi:hypothetical protein